MKGNKGEAVLSDKQRDLITIVGFVLSLGVVVSFAILVNTWKVNIENNVILNTEKIERIEKRQDEYDSFILDTNMKLTRIQTDIGWIRSSMEDK